jgi:hypothetical protein
MTDLQPPAEFFHFENLDPAKQLLLKPHIDDTSDRINKAATVLGNDDSRKVDYFSKALAKSQMPLEIPDGSKLVHELELKAGFVQDDPIQPIEVEKDNSKPLVDSLRALELQPQQVEILQTLYLPALENALADAQSTLVKMIPEVVANQEESQLKPVRLINSIEKRWFEENSALLNKIDRIDNKAADIIFNTPTNLRNGLDRTWVKSLSDLHQRLDGDPLRSETLKLLLQKYLSHKVQSEIIHQASDVAYGNRPGTSTE